MASRIITIRLLPLLLADPPIYGLHDAPALQAQKDIDSSAFSEITKQARSHYTYDDLGRNKPYSMYCNILEILSKRFTST